MPTPETSTIKKQHAAPSYVWLSFKIALTFALFSVLFNVLNDCDEVYNYWEPLHFLVTLGEGGGFQTWEYSPVSDTKSILCLGRDWHYFPSRFLLPQGGEQWDVGYLPSNFSGQLPGQYKPVGSEARVVDSTRVDGSHFNVENLEEPDRFLSGGAERCDFIMDRDSTPGTREELYVAQSDKWTSVANRTILEPRSSFCCSASLSLLPDIRRNCFDEYWEQNDETQ
ncbi:hypothetical protein X801_04415, partial [Opisthorchis viverrini]